jgi:hypothetical protein
LLAGDVGSGAQVLGLEHAEQIDGMAGFIARGRHVAQPCGKGTHRAESRLLRGRRKRPRVAERHRTESLRLSAVAGPHAARDIEQRDPIHRAAAELIRRSVHKLLERVGDFDDAYVGWTGRSHSRRSVLRTAGKGSKRDRCPSLEERSPRHPTLNLAGQAQDYRTPGICQIRQV